MENETFLVNNVKLFKILAIIIGSVAGGVLLLVIVAVIAVLRSRRKKGKVEIRNKDEQPNATKTGIF